MRRATEAVTGFIGETFGAVQAVTLRRAEAPVMAEFRRLNAVRREAALADTVLTELLRSINRNMATVGVAIVLLVAGDDVASGVISVGDLTIFLVYLPRLTDYMAFVGDIIVQHRRTGVAVERVRALAVDAPDTVLLDRTRVPLEASRRDRALRCRRRRAVPITRGHRSLLHLPRRGGGSPGCQLRDRRRQLHRGDGRGGIRQVDAGAGAVGLVPASGEIRWNDDWSRTRPPSSSRRVRRTRVRCPGCSRTRLEDNIALGSRVTHERLREAVQLAVLDPDLERLERGWGPWSEREG
jgi:ATP-binding cassette, subfamily B, bacterial